MPGRSGRPDRWFVRVMIKVDSSRGALLLLHHPAVEVYEALQPGQKFNRRARQSSVERRAPEPADVQMYCRDFPKFPRAAGIRVAKRCRFRRLKSMGPRNIKLVSPAAAPLQPPK